MVWDSLRFSYDIVAEKYESRFAHELEDKPRDRELLETFASSVGDPVADIGCGPGQVGAFVRQRDCRVIGVDLSERMAALADDRLDAAVVADMRLLPFADESLGGLLAFYCVIHLGRAELGAALREFGRVLRPGGAILFSVHEGQGEVVLDTFLEEPVPFTATFFELGELVRASEVAGLDVTIAERRMPYRSEGGTVRLYVEAEKR